MWVHVVLLLGGLTAATGVSVRSLTVPLQLATQRRCGGCWPVRMWTSTKKTGCETERSVCHGGGRHELTAAGRRG